MNPETIRIGEGRYVVVLENRAFSKSEFLEKADFLRRRLDEWWSSDEKFTIIGIDNSVALHFERVEEE